MKSRALLTGLVIVLLVVLLMTPISDAWAQDGTPPDPTSDSVEVVNEYFSIVTTTTRDGAGITASRINGPSEPPDQAAWEASRVSALDRAAVVLPDFPAYSWVFGCSAVSGAMIASYYDNNGYDNLYAGPTNGGVMPQVENPSWGTWIDDEDESYPNNPLVASRDGVDGRSGYGSIDDYWVSYFSSANDPYITGSWTQHAWGTAIGDYMFTSQSDYGNVDGSTTFYNYSDGSRLPCYVLEGEESIYDGHKGQKHFYEARGYSVTECYSQYTDNYNDNGFTLEDFQSEIDAGYPVMINLEGHTVVGFGYNGSTIYIRDTWDSDVVSDPHSMTWGSSYQGMLMYAVSVLHVAEPASAFSRTSPSADEVGVNPNSVTLAWEESTDALSYDYCIGMDMDTPCAEWESAGTSTSVVLSSLESLQTYYWQVRANGSSGITYANGAEGFWWPFTTYDPSIMTEKNFLPLLTR